MEQIDWLSNAGLVFHYTKLSTALEHILPSGLIAFGKLKNSNDLHERNVWNVSTTVRGGSEKDARDALKAGMSHMSKIREGTRTFCTIKDTEVKDRVNGKHFGRGYMNFPLWWHYAEKNRGVCLAFDKIKLEEAVKKTVDLHKVELVGFNNIEYDLAAIDILKLTNPPSTEADSTSAIRNIEDHNRSNRKAFYFTKDSSWSNENEFRLVVFCNDANAEFKVDLSDFIVGIILGHEFPICYRSLIFDATNKFKVGVAAVDYSEQPRLYIPN